VVVPISPSLFQLQTLRVTNSLSRGVLMLVI
jgi:hypothetical protein